VIAVDKDSLIIAANEFYTNGEFEKAIEAYEEVLNTGYEAPELYYNLANAYYKSYKITIAILNFERACLLAPNDEDINYNLELARRYVVDKIDIIPQIFITTWLNKIMRIFSTDVWAVLSIVSFLLFLLLFSLYLYINRLAIKKISFWISVLAFIVSTSSFIFSYQQKENIINHNAAIIFSPSVTVKSSPDESGNDLFLIHEGTKVTVEDRVGDWKEIKLSDGKKGWLKATDIVLI